MSITYNYGSRNGSRPHSAVTPRCAKLTLLGTLVVTSSSTIVTRGPQHHIFEPGFVFRKHTNGLVTLVMIATAAIGSTMLQPKKGLAANPAWLATPSYCANAMCPSRQRLVRSWDLGVFLAVCTKTAAK